MGVAAAILAGGQGRRLGGALKPLLALPDGRRIVDHQLDVLRPLFDAVVIVAADTAPFQELVAASDGAGCAAVDVITDRAGPGLGPLAGLDAALGWLPADCDAIVCVAGDMPFLAAAVLQWLRDAPAGAAAVVPRLATGPEPLCARYGRTLASLVAAELAAGRRAMHALIDRIDRDRDGGAGRAGGSVAWLDEATCRRLDPVLRTFTNINTPDDLLVDALGSHRSR